MQTHLPQHKGNNELQGVCDISNVLTAIRTNQEDTIAIYGKFRDSIKTKHTTFIGHATTYPSKFQH